MMRSNDPLEEQLRRTPVREPNAEWRESILRAAEGELPREKEGFNWARWCGFFLNPGPAGWAAVAAVWALVLFFNSQTPAGSNVTLAATAKPISRILHERQEMLASAVEGEKIVIPAPRKRVPGPQGRAPITLIFV